MKKLLAMILCVVMVVGMLSTVAVAETKVIDIKATLLGVYDDLAMVQEYGVAKAAKRLLADIGAGTGLLYSDLETKHVLSAEEFADYMWSEFVAPKVDELFVPVEGDYKATMQSFFKALNEGWKAAGEQYIGERWYGALAELLASLAGTDPDDALWDWIKDIQS